MKTTVKTLEGLIIRHTLALKNDIRLELVTTVDSRKTVTEFIVINPFIKDESFRKVSFERLEQAAHLYDSLTNQNDIQFGLDNIEDLIGY